MAELKRITSSVGLIAVVVTTALVATAIAGCGGEPDPSSPDDAYQIFRTALFEADAETMWERTDPQTRDYFEDRYERLVEMDELIERYLPQTDHRIARTQSGAELLDEIESGRLLFVTMMQPGPFVDDDAVELGARLQELRMAEDGQSAVAVTRGGQEFVLVTDDDHWYVNLVESGSFLETTFQWLTDNEEALEQTVEDLIEEERQVREEIIADLMDPDEP